MAPSTSKSIHWEPRDQRVWVVLSAEEDQLTARLVCTFFEANEILARVGSRGGRYTVEVPADQEQQARALHGEDPSGSNVVNLPPLQEVSTVRTSHTTVRRIREELIKRGVTQPGEVNHLRNGFARAAALLAALLAILAAVAWLVFLR